MFPHLTSRNVCVQNVEIHKYLVDGISDYYPITTGIVALTLKYIFLDRAESIVKLCKASMQKIFNPYVLLYMEDEDSLLIKEVGFTSSRSTIEPVEL